MKTIPVEYVIRRLNAIELAAERGLESALAELGKLQHGLEFYQEILPLTDGPGAPKKSSRRKKAKRRR